MSISDEASLSAISEIAKRYMREQKLDPATAQRWVSAVAITAGADIPPWLLDPSRDVDSAGTIARVALEGLLAQNADTHLQSVAAQEAERASQAQGQVVDPITLGATVLIGLSLLSKISYKDGKWAIAPGFPGLSDVLSKVGELLKNLPGPT